MKFDFYIGNPPYHETKGNTKNIDVWPNFIKIGTEISSVACIIHPGRWILPKKQMQSVNKLMIESGLKVFDYYPNAADLFNGVAIGGGITTTIFDSGYQGGIRYYVNGDEKGIYNTSNKFFSDIYEEEAYNKVFPKINTNSMRDRVVGNIGCLGGGEFGYHKHSQIGLLMDDPSTLQNPVLVWANNSFGRGGRFAWYYIEESALKNIPDGFLESRKVMLDKKGNSLIHGRGNVICNLPKIVEARSTASGDVLFVFPEHDTDYELELIRSMFMTKTARFLMSITQKDLYVRGFENIPDYTYFIPYLNGRFFSDDFFYTFFDFSNDLIKPELFTAVP